jgi:predicted phage terminase large subunit-like protein
MINDTQVTPKHKLKRLIGKKPNISRLRTLHKQRRFNEPESMEFIEPTEETSIDDVNDAFLERKEVISTYDEALKAAVMNPLAVQRELCKRDFTEFIRYFWDCVAHDILHWNWHIDYISDTLTDVAQTVAAHLPKKNDVIINIPPGMTKSLTCSVMFPVWCWVNWPWMRFICASYSAQLSLEQADLSRELVRSQKFRELFPEITIKEDKDTKSNYRIQYLDKNGIRKSGGNRFTTSVGGTLTGFHGHILIIDDPLNPKEALSETKLRLANHWMTQTLSTRKIDKSITPTILIMQRLHQDDPTGHLLDSKKEKIKHICMPGELGTYTKYVRPIELIHKYTDGMLDPIRMPRSVLQELETDLGQYGYAGQIGQHPVPPGGGMFHTDMFMFATEMPHPNQILFKVRYWDKAGTQDDGAYTCGVLMARLRNGKFIILDVKRGQWSTDTRETIIRATAETDGPSVKVWHEQEPGSGGKESAEATILNLAGFSNAADRPTGDKIFRSDPYSVQVNRGNISLLVASWNKQFIDEHTFFPYGKFKDQVDAASGAFTKLALKKFVRNLLD